MTVLKIVKWIITWKKVDLADLVKDAKSVVSFESNGMISHTHGLAAKTVSKWRPLKSLL